MSKRGCAGFLQSFHGCMLVFVNRDLVDYLLQWYPRPTHHHITRRQNARFVLAVWYNADIKFICCLSESKIFVVSSHKPEVAHVAALINKFWKQRHIYPSFNFIQHESSTFSGNGYFSWPFFLTLTPGSSSWISNRQRWRSYPSRHESMHRSGKLPCNSR